MSSITLGYRVEHPKYGTGYVRSIRRSSESRPYVCVFRQSDGTWRKHHLSAAEIRQKQLEAMRQALAKRREARQAMVSEEVRRLDGLDNEAVNQVLDATNRSR